MIINVKVKPNSSRQKIEKLDNNNYLIYLKSAPKDNKANAELINLLIKEFKVTINDIKIKSGKTSRKKMIEISDRNFSTK